MAMMMMRRRRRRRRGKRRRRIQTKILSVISKMNINPIILIKTIFLCNTVNYGFYKLRQYRTDSSVSFSSLKKKTNLTEDFVIFTFPDWLEK